MTNKEIWSKLTELLGDHEVARRFQKWGLNLLKKELAKRSNMNVSELFLQQAGHVLDDLNRVTGRRFTLTEETKALIKARMSAGFGVDDFKDVHKSRAAVWLDDPKMREFLRPSTLYRASRFEEYLASAIVAPPRKDWSPGQAREDQPKKEDHSALIAKLMARPWHGFATWAEFVRWTMQFPDENSLGRYEMPARIRKMRTAPLMCVKVLRGQGFEWAEAEYEKIKVHELHELHE